MKNIPLILTLIAAFLGQYAHGDVNRSETLQKFLKLGSERPFEQTYRGTIPSSVRKQVLEGKYKAYEKNLNDVELFKEKVDLRLKEAREEASADCHVTVELMKSGRYEVLIVLGTLENPAFADFELEFKDRGEERGLTYTVTSDGVTLHISSSRSWAKSELQIQTHPDGTTFTLERKRSLFRKKPIVSKAVCQVTSPEITVE